MALTSKDFGKMKLNAKKKTYSRVPSKQQTLQLFHLNTRPQRLDMEGNSCCLIGLLELKEVMCVRFLSQYLEFS